MKKVKNYLHILYMRSSGKQRDEVESKKIIILGAIKKSLKTENKSWESKEVDMKVYRLNKKINEIIIISFN